MQVVARIDAQVHRVVQNLRAVTTASGANLQDAVKRTGFLTNLIHLAFARLNEIMAQYFSAAYLARSAVGVSQLPRGAPIEIDAILVEG